MKNAKTFEDYQRDQYEKNKKLKQTMDESTSIPEYLIASAQLNASHCRRDMIKLRDLLRKHPDKIFTKILVAHMEEQLKMYEEDIKEMREFYGKSGLLS